MTRGHLLWANKERASKVIDLQNLFNDYWTSKAGELTLLGQSSQSVRTYLIEKPRGRCGWKASLLSKITVLNKYYCSSHCKRHRGHLIVLA